MRRLDDHVLVAGQIGIDDLPALAAAGVTRVVNNRPDGEEPGQPTDADLAAAARAAGIDWAHVPMAGGVSPDQIAAMGEALDGAGGDVLAFCRSGTRSTYLWALARAAAGEDVGMLAEKAAAAGYDLTPVSALMERLRKN